MSQIELLRQRLLRADSVAGMLATGWEAFEFVRGVAGANADRSADMYPAFTFARGAAVRGRNAIAFAPSMPANQAVLSENATLLEKSPVPVVIDHYGVYGSFGPAQPEGRGDTRTLETSRGDVPGGGGAARWGAHRLPAQ